MAKIKSFHKQDAMVDLRTAMAVAYNTKSKDEDDVTRVMLGGMDMFSKG